MLADVMAQKMDRCGTTLVFRLGVDGRTFFKSLFYPNLLQPLLDHRVEVATDRQLYDQGPSPYCTYLREHLACRRRDDARSPLELDRPPTRILVLRAGSDSWSDVESKLGHRPELTSTHVNMRDPSAVAQAIYDALGEACPPDAVLLARGGGEDVFALDHLEVADALFEAARQVPTLLAVGHAADRLRIEMALHPELVFSVPADAAAFLLQSLQSARQGSLAARCARVARRWRASGEHGPRPPPLPTGHATRAQAIAPHTQFFRPLRDDQLRKAILACVAAMLFAGLWLARLERSPPALRPDLTRHDEPTGDSARRARISTRTLARKTRKTAGRGVRPPRGEQTPVERRAGKPISAPQMGDPVPAEKGAADEHEASVEHHSPYPEQPPAAPQAVSADQPTRHPVSSSPAPGDMLQYPNGRVVIVAPAPGIPIQRSPLLD